MEQSHQVHRRQLHAGRLQLAHGDLQQAVVTWKAALESAYGAHDFATMFVLARNLGQACQRQAASGGGLDREARIATLERAGDYFQYALAVVEQCSLDCDVLQRHRMVTKVVRSLERHRDQVEADLKSLRRQLQEQKQQSLEQQTVHEDLPVSTVEVCTTCGAEASLGNTIVVDEADGCPYCEACFIEFYESEQAQPSGAADEDALSSSSASRCDEEEILDDFDSDDEEEPEPTPSELSLLSEDVQFDAQLMMERIEEDEEEKAASIASSNGSQSDDKPSVVSAAQDPQPHTLDVEEGAITQLPIVSLKRTSYPISVLLSLRPPPSQFECSREIQTSAVYCSPTGSSKAAAKPRKKVKKDKPADRHVTATSAPNRTPSTLPTIELCQALRQADTSPSSIDWNSLDLI